MERRLTRKQRDEIRTARHRLYHGQQRQPLEGSMYRSRRLARMQIEARKNTDRSESCE